MQQSSEQILNILLQGQSDHKDDLRRMEDLLRASNVRNEDLIRALIEKQEVSNDKKFKAIFKRINTNSSDIEELKSFKSHLRGIYAALSVLAAATFLTVKEYIFKVFL